MSWNPFDTDGDGWSLDNGPVWFVIGVAVVALVFSWSAL